MRRLSPLSLGHEPGMGFREKRGSVSVQCDVLISNELGLHARPAAEFVRRASGFRSDIWLVKDGKRFSVASLIEVMRANVDCGTTVTLQAQGPDAATAVERLTQFLREIKDETS
jgi:phosphotransferase system HPr (HPr) family protein